MEAILLNQEISEQELNLGSNKLMLTNKRLIFNQHFIGLSELKSIKVEPVEIKQSVNLHDKVITNIVGIICFAIPMLHSIIEKDVLNSGITVFIMVAGLYLIIGYGGGFLAAFIVLTIIKNGLNATSKTVKVVSLKIIKNDNTYFLNSNLQIEHFDELRNFEATINNIIYK